VSEAEFAAQAAELERLGLDPAALAAIVQAGPEQGTGLATTITEGGPEMIRQLNGIQRQIERQVKAGVWGVSRGLAAGLRTELGRLDEAMEALGASMTATLRRERDTWT
jgi:hypothetical protein